MSRLRLFVRRRPVLALSIFALLARVIAALTHSTWVHLDEWFQTVELAQILAKGFGTYSQEVDLHLRNLSWPIALSTPLKLSDWIAPESIRLRIFGVSLLPSLLDLGMIWGFYRTAERFRTKTPGAGPGWTTLAVALLVLPWFTVADSVRPSAEHVSGALAWVAMGMLSSERLAWAGFFAVALAAAKYPAGLLSAGIFLSILLQSPKRLPRFAFGAVAGLGVFGTADWAWYGRPWESLWMYLQFNVLTDAGPKMFGWQSTMEYPLHFTHWLGVLAPFGLVLAALMLVGLARGLHAREAWAIAPLIYLAGHLLIGHKEKRFMWPIENYLLFAAWVGAMNWGYRFRSAFDRPIVRRLSYVLFGASLIANAALFARALWGENLTMFSTYFEAPRHLRDHPETCGIITMRYPVSSFLPRGSEKSDGIPVAYFPAERRRTTRDQAQVNALFWSVREPSCAEGQRLLLHVDKPDEAWEHDGCELLASGVLGWLPRSAWPWALKAKLESGPWYACPPAIRKFFASEVSEVPFSPGFVPFASVPPYGITGRELIESAHAKRPEPACRHLCVPGRPI